MNKSKTKHLVYLRIFSTFIATYMMLMIGLQHFLYLWKRKLQGKNWEIVISK